MSAGAPVLPQTGGPAPAQTTRMTHMTANRAHTQSRDPDSSGSRAHEYCRRVHLEGEGRAYTNVTVCVTHFSHFSDCLRPERFPGPEVPHQPSPDQRPYNLASCCRFGARRRARARKDRNKELTQRGCTLA